MISYRSIVIGAALASCCLLPRADAAALPAPVSLSVSVNTNGVLIAPPNFWQANSNALNTVVTGLADYALLSGTNTWTGTNDFAWIVVPDAWWLANSNALNAAVTDTGAGDALLDEDNTFTGTNDFAWIIVPDAWWLANSNALNAAIGDITYAELLADDNDWTGTQRFSEPLTLTLTNALAWENESQTATPTKLHLVSGNLWVHLNDRNRYAFTDAALAIGNTNALGWWNSGNTAVQAQLTSPSAGIVALDGTGGTYALRLPASAVPSAPPAGQGYLYYRTTDGRLYWRNATTTYDLTSGLYLGDKGDISVTEGGWLLNSNPITATNANFVIRVSSTNDLFGVKVGDTSHLNAAQISLDTSGNTELLLAGRGRVKGDDITEQTTLLASSAGLTVTPGQGDINLAADVQIPSNTLTIGTNAASATNPTLLIAPTKTGTASANWRSFADNTRISYSSGSGYTMSSYDAFPTFTGDLNYASQISFHFRPRYSGTGYMTNIYGLWGYPQIDGGGTVSAYSGLHLQQPFVTGGSTLATNRLVYLGVANAGTTDNWSLYSAGPVYAASLSVGGVNPMTAFQATNATLTTLAGLSIVGEGAIVLSDYLGEQLALVFQPISAPLTALSSNPQLYQATNSALTTLAGLGLNGTGNLLRASVLGDYAPYDTLIAQTNTWTHQIFTTGITVNAITLDGDDLATTLDTKADNDTVYALAASIADLGYISESSVGSLVAPGTNTVDSAFEKLIVAKPPTYHTELLETLTPEIDFDGAPIKNIPVTGNMTFTYANYSDTQKVELNLTNDEGAEYLLNWGILNWTTDVPPLALPAGQRMKVVIEVGSTNLYGSYETRQDAAQSVHFGGTGRQSHPQNYILIGDGGNALRAAAIGTGLRHSGTGQAMTLSLTNSVPTPSLITHTTVLAGASVWTNVTGGLSPTVDSSTFLSADVLFSGVTNTVALQTMATFRTIDGTATITTNQWKAPSAAALWAGWVAGGTSNLYPVLKVGGLEGEEGVLQIANIQQWSISLTAAEIPQPGDWDGYVFSENYEGPGLENPLLATAYNYDDDNTQQVYHGTYAMKLTGESYPRQGLPSTYASVAGRFNMRIANSPNGGRQVWRLGDSVSAAGSTMAGINLGTDRKLSAVCGSATVTTTDPVPTDTWVSVYFHYAKGTGSNAVWKIGFSTTDNKPTDTNKIASVTTGTSTGNVGNIGLQRLATGDVDRWYDAIVVHNNMDWDNLPDGLPDDI